MEARVWRAGHTSITLATKIELEDGEKVVISWHSGDGKHMQADAGEASTKEVISAAIDLLSVMTV